MTDKFSDKVTRAASQSDALGQERSILKVAHRTLHSGQIIA
jgi:hypothetical protein